jgi:putative serine protease PepD
MTNEDAHLPPEPQPPAGRPAHPTEPTPPAQASEQGQAAEAAEATQPAQPLWQRGEQAAPAPEAGQEQQAGSGQPADFWDWSNSAASDESPTAAQPAAPQGQPGDTFEGAPAGQPVQPEQPVQPASEWGRPEQPVTGQPVTGQPGEQRPTEQFAQMPWYQPAGAYGPAGYGQPAGLPGPPGGPYGGYGQPGGPGPRRPPSGARKWLVGAAAALVLVLAGGAVGGVTVHALDGGTVVDSPVAASDASAKKGSLAAMVQSVMPSVVSIKVTTSQQEDEGSGVIIRSDGMILTNNHVVEAAAGGNGSIEVDFSDGSTASAKIIGRDPTGDLAVIQASGRSGLKPATLGDSSALRVGDSVVAIGSPLGLSGSVTQGIVSALNRSYSVQDDQQQQQGQGQLPFSNNNQQQQSSGTTITIPNAIQTDAAINPGNSGGPLLNLSGQVIGINSAIRGADSGGSGQSGNIGIGFAIPINTAHQAADQLIKSGKVQHAYLGVQITDATGDTQSNSGTAQGALVSAVTSGGPAAKAGLAKGDVITKVDGTTIPDSDSLVAAIQKHKPGDKITVTYTRNGQTKTASVTLGDSPS